jgi:hypothetical protein
VIADPRQNGLAISAAAVRWLGIAGAGISIDQCLPDGLTDDEP